jgi:hypothetical protein
VDLSLRFNSQCVSNFIGYYTDAFQQRILANFSKMGDGDLNAKTVSMCKTETGLKDVEFRKSDSYFMELEMSPEGMINLNKIKMDSKKDHEQQQIREISPYKWNFPYLFYCKGNSELVIRNMHRRNNRLVYEIKDYFICFTDLDKQVLKSGHITGRNMEGPDEEDFNSSPEDNYDQYGDEYGSETPSEEDPSEKEDEGSNKEHDSEGGESEKSRRNSEEGSINREEEGSKKSGSALKSQKSQVSHAEGSEAEHS